MIRTDFTALFCILVPLPLILGAPVDDVLKQQQQQMSSGAYREEPYWSYYNQESDDQPGGAFMVKTRALDSLGRGNILRSLNGLGSEWGTDKGSNWRFGTLGSPKRGGGLDSLGRGNILRRVNYDDEISNFIHSLGPVEGRNAFLRSLDSLGKGNILKRSVRTISSSQQQHFAPYFYCFHQTSVLLYDVYWKQNEVWGRGLASKKLDSLAGDVFGLAKRFDSLSGATFGTQKRNFDEIDRNGFGAFLKRNFDEIDRNGLGFYKRNFDEIDRTGFGAFVKRAA